MRLRDRLIAAIASGVVLGAKLGAALLVMGIVLLGMSRIYLAVQQAQNGQVAFEYIQRVISQQQQLKPGPTP